MKIAYLTTTPLPSEKANIIQSVEMCKALTQTGAEVDFFCPRASPDITDFEAASYLEGFFGETLSFRIRLSPYRTLKGRFGALLSIPWLLRKAYASANYDYYYIRNSYLLCVMSLLPRPLIFEQHQWNSYRNSILSCLVRYFTLFGGKRSRCKLFVCISEELRQRWVKKGIPQEKTLTAHDAVNLDAFTPVLSTKQARRVLGLKEDGIIVAYVGSLYCNRALEDIIQAARVMPDVSFQLVGGPESEKKKHEAKARREGIGNISFMGRVSRKRIPCHLFASDVLLFTMNDQTLTFDICSPIKLFEYMAAARIIVAPDLPSMREVLTPSYSFLYTFLEKQSLEGCIRSAILAVKYGKSEEMGLMARRFVERQHTWDIRMKRILAELNWQKDKEKPYDALLLR